MTGFILHGGHTRYDNEDNKNFFKELLNEFNNPKVLLVYFARPKAEWNERFDDNKKKFGKCRPIIASKKEFKKQIDDSDVIFLSGGGTDNLLKD